MRAKMLLPLVALLVLALVSVALGACGGGGDDKALFEKVATVWKNKDAEGAKEIYADNANLYWNWPGAREGVTTDAPQVTSGIEAISALAASGDMGYPTLQGESVYALDIPADEPVENISADYKGARFVYLPISAGTGLFMMVLEVRDGKVQTMVVTPMK